MKTANLPINPRTTSSTCVVVMGISGSGKTELSRRLAVLLDVPFIEGDTFHSNANRAKMQAGTALQDSDRWAWLEVLVSQCQAQLESHGGFVLACSALRRAYRDQLRAGLPMLKFVFLDAPASVVSQRVAERTDHFMPASLVDSQLATLEKPDTQTEPDTVHISADQALEKVVAQSISALTSMTGQGISVLQPKHSTPKATA